MNYKLIAIDIDGTLLNTQGTITERNYATLKKAVAQGVIVVLCTGRSYFMAQKVVGGFDFELPLVLHNGAQIVNSSNGQMIAHWTLDQQNARHGLMLMKEFALEPIVYDFHKGKHILVYESIDPTNEAYVRYMSTKESILHKTDDLLSYLDHNPTQLVAIHQEAIIKNVMPILKNHIDANVFTSGRLFNLEYWFLEVLRCGASKAAAVEHLAKLHNIDQKEIMAIGDNFNDLEMMEYAHLSVAMDNAPNEVKAIADFVTDSNNDDGVAKAIERFVF
ncbi:TPA: HAD family phosphatase [Candidatus Poribacteria bacterium]|nr:HAD family phosphatase [Candidatus Poribacteria bacterium]